MEMKKNTKPFSKKNTKILEALFDMELLIKLYFIGQLIVNKINFVRKKWQFHSKFPKIYLQKQFHSKFPKTFLQKKICIGNFRPREGGYQQRLLQSGRLKQKILQMGGLALGFGNLSHVKKQKKLLNISECKAI